MKDYQKHITRLLRKVFDIGQDREERPHREVLEESVVLGGYALEFIRAPLYKELKAHLVDLAEQEHSKLVASKDPISREEYKGFIQAITLIALYVPNLVEAGRLARERLEASEFE